MPNWKKVITSGSNGELNTLKLSSVSNAGTDTDKFLVLDGTGNVDFRTGAQVLSDIGGQGASPGTVSSSAQISGYNKFLEFTGDGVISSSIQVNANSITNFDANVKDKMNADGVISSSAQLTSTFDTRYLNTTGDGVISSSAQLTSTFDTRYLNTSGDGVISSSAQLTPIFDTRYLNTSGDGVISSSVQVNANSITNFDSNVKDKMNADGVISSSAQVTISSTTGYTTFSSSIAADIASLNGAGYVDTTGTPIARQLTIFDDANTLKGDGDVVYYSGSLNNNYYLMTGIHQTVAPLNMGAGIQTSTLYPNSLIVGHGHIGHASAEFTSSFIMSANTGYATWGMETILTSFSFPGPATNAILHKADSNSNMWVNYHINVGGAHRVGQLMVVTNGAGNLAAITDVATSDIGGSTAGVTFSTINAGGYVYLRVTTTAACTGELEIKRNV